MPTLVMQVAMMMDYALTYQLIVGLHGILFMELLAQIYKLFLMKEMLGPQLVVVGKVIV